MGKLPDAYQALPSNSTYFPLSSSDNHLTMDSFFFLVYVSLGYQPPLGYKLHEGKDFILLCS